MKQDTLANATSVAWDYFSTQISDTSNGVGRGVDLFLTDSSRCHVSYPINNLVGKASLVEQYWSPLLQAFPDLERRDDVFLTGEFEGSVWAASTGYFVGTFKKDWLNIPASRAATFIRYGEIVRIENDKVTESYVILDIVDVARQAGKRLIPKSLGAEHIAPGPETHDGILLTPQDEPDSAKSLSLVEAMARGLLDYDGKSVASTHQEDFWHPNMMWYGPGGIGTTRGLKGFQDYHQKPFLKFIPDRVGGHHYARIASGQYVASGGWPSIHATTSGESWVSTAFPSGQKIGMRVMDFWRREGDHLKENWIMIDIPDVLKQCGIDVFADLRQ